MKQLLIPSALFLAALALVSCDGGKKQEQAPEASSQEQAVPRTPGEEMLAVMLVVKDQATANANAGKIRELAARLPKDMPHEESVSIMNEMLRFASRECDGSLDLEDALKTIKFDTGEYTGSVPLDVDGFEPTPDEPGK